MAVAWVQDISVIDDTYAEYSTFGTTFASSVAAGSLIVGWCGSGSNDVAQVDDNGSRSYTLHLQIWDATNSQGHTVFYYLNHPGGSTTVMATFSAGDTVYVRMGLAEYSGVATASAPDGAAGQVEASPGTGTDGANSTTITTTADGDLIFGVYQDIDATHPGGPNMTAGTGFTGRTETGNVGKMENRIQSSAGSIEATFTISLNHRAIITVQGFKAAGGGGATAVPVFMNIQRQMRG